MCGGNPGCKGTRNDKELYGGSNGAKRKKQISASKYIVLGACCKKSEETFENTKTALKEMGISDEVKNIGDAVEIARYSVMQTPALVIGNKVVSYGKMLKVDEVKKLVEKKLQILYVCFNKENDTDFILDLKYDIIKMYF